MVLDQLVQDECPNLHEQVSLVHFYQTELLPLHFEQRVIQQHNNVEVYKYPTINFSIFKHINKNHIRYCYHFLRSDDDCFIILFNECFWTNFQPCNIGILIQNMDIMMRWYTINWTRTSFCITSRRCFTHRDRYYRYVSNNAKVDKLLVLL